MKNASRNTNSNGLKAVVNFKKCNRNTWLKRLFSKTESSVGLDIGSFYIKAAEINGGTGGLKLANFAAGEIQSKQVAGAIRMVLEKAEITAKKVNISISGPSVIVRYIRLPKMRKDELRSAMQFEAEKHIPFDMKEVSLDCQILDRSEQSGKMNVLLVAAKKSLIEGIIQTVHEAGLEPDIIDVDAFALVNAFTENFPSQDKDRVITLLNIGAEVSTINILKGGVPYFTRDVSIAGNDLTRTLIERFGIDFSSAEKLKCSPGERFAEIFGVARPVLDNLIDEIRLSFDYYESQFEEGVDKIYLSGGCSRLKDLDKFLSEALGLKIKFWDPTSCFNISPDIDHNKLSNAINQMAVAVGLALRGYVAHRV